jgi:hypothetical protein
MTTTYERPRTIAEEADTHKIVLSDGRRLHFRYRLVKKFLGRHVAVRIWPVRLDRYGRPTR